MTELLRVYKDGVGFRRDDVLEPRAGARLETFGAIDKCVVVLDQCPLVPHRYTVLGERESPRTPADRFVMFEINGHDWHKVGRA